MLKNDTSMDIDNAFVSQVEVQSSQTIPKGDSHISRFTENCRGFWQSYSVAILIFLFTLSCDTVSTISFMKVLGVEAEMHPFVRIVSIIFGPVFGPIIGGCAKAVACFIVAIYCRRFAPHIFISASVIYFFATWYNMIGIIPTW